MIYIYIFWKWAHWWRHRHGLDRFRFKNFQSPGCRVCMPKCGAMSLLVKGTVRVWSGSRCSPRLGTQPAALHRCAWSLVIWVPLWGPLWGPLCRWPCYHCWIARGMCQEALDLERSNGGERAESNCRKDKDHDLWYGPGAPAEFRRVIMRHLSRWSGQQQHLLHQLQALGAQEMQWAQALDKRPWLDVHGAGELHAPCMADYRGKSK